MQCNATRRNGEACRSHAVKGTTVCRMHGGSAPQVREAGRIRAARMQAHAAAERMVARSGVDVDPIEHLLDSLHISATLVVVWGEMVAELDAEGARLVGDGLRGQLGYERIEIEGVDMGLDVRSRESLLALDRSGMAKLHPFVSEYESAVERRAKLAKLCIDAGIAERQVQLAEQEGQLLARVIRGVLTDLGVVDRPEVPSIVRRHLTLVSSERAQRSA